MRARSPEKGLPVSTAVCGCRCRSFELASTFGDTEYQPNRSDRSKILYIFFSHSNPFVYCILHRGTCHIARMRSQFLLFQYFVLERREHIYAQIYKRSRCSLAKIEYHQIFLTNCIFIAYKFNVVFFVVFFYNFQSNLRYFISLKIKYFVTGNCLCTTFLPSSDRFVYSTQHRRLVSATQLFKNKIICNQEFCMKSATACNFDGDVWVGPPLIKICLS